MFDAVVISDLHLNAFNCQAKALDKFLDRIRRGQMETRRLILNGDVFDHFDKRLKKSNWKVLSDLRSLADGVELVWVLGNHDATGPAEEVAGLIGADFYPDEYVFESGASRFVVVHGDRYDKFVTDRPILSAVAAKAYDVLQWLDRSNWLAGVAKRSSKAYLRCTELVEQRAVAYADQHGYDVALCGHTHRAYSSARYYNSGCWTDPTCCTFLTVRDGRVEVRAEG